MLDGILSRVKVMIRNVRLTVAKAVLKDIFDAVQVESFGNAFDTTVLSPYGLIYNPVDDMTGVMFSVSGNPNSSFCIFFDPDNIPENLKNGEVCVGNFQKGIYSKYTNEQKIEIYRNKVLTLADLLTHTHNSAMGLTTTPLDPSGNPILPI